MKDVAIKVARKIKRIVLEKEKPQASELPPDEYEDEIPPKELILDECNKLVFSVKRAGDLGLPCVDIRHYVESERFTGFTRKGIHFPLELLLELSDICREVADECADKGLE